MESKHSWLGEQAFGADASELVSLTYKSHRDALLFMRSVLDDDNGIGILKGPRSSGKTTIVRRLGEQLPGSSAVALIDGTRIKPRELLSRMLAQFGYDTGLESNDELEKMVSVFAIQQTRSYLAPVLIVDNADRMYPSALRTLNTLAELTAKQRYAIRIILTGRDALNSILASEGMVSIAKRIAGNFVVTPLSLREALLYLHARLGACGVNNADTVFPVDVCDRLYEQSGGWPGLMNQFAIEAIGRATDFPLRVTDTQAQDDAEDQPASDLPLLDVVEPVGPSPPRLIVSRDGVTISDFTLNEKKVLIGRSDFSDILIDDDFVSKLHAVLLLYSDALVLLDLNSANGITVNSRQVRSTVLKDNDIISLGNHRLKIKNAPAVSDEMAELLKSPDTIKMKNLIDLRREEARRRVKAAETGKQQN